MISIKIFRILIFPPRISDGISQKKLNLKLHAETVTKEIEFLLLEFLKKHFPGRWYFEAENIRRIPGKSYP